MRARFALGLSDCLCKDIAGAPALQQIAQVAADCFATGWALQRLRSLRVDRDRHVNRVVHTSSSMAHITLPAKLRTNDDWYDLWAILTAVMRQYCALPGVRGKGMASRTLARPVTQARVPPARAGAR